MVAVSYRPGNYRGPAWLPSIAGASLALAKTLFFIIVVLFLIMVLVGLFVGSKPTRISASLLSHENQASMIVSSVSRNVIKRAFGSGVENILGNRRSNSNASPAIIHEVAVWPNERARGRQEKAAPGRAIRSRHRIAIGRAEFSN